MGEPPWTDLPWVAMGSLRDTYQRGGAHFGRSHVSSGSSIAPPLEMVLAREPVSHLIAIAYHEYGYKLKQIADLIRCTLCHGQPPVAASGGGTLR